jgi:hypothetical protein
LYSKSPWREWESVKQHLKKYYQVAAKNPGDPGSANAAARGARCFKNAGKRLTKEAAGPAHFENLREARQARLTTSYFDSPNSTF